MTSAGERSSGTFADLQFAVGNSSLGSVLVATSSKGIAAITIGDGPDALIHDLAYRFPKANLIGGDGAFNLVLTKIVGLVENPATGLDLQLDLSGTPFQKRVWKAVRDIPAGSTATYTQIAERIGMPKAVRAVAAACAANKIAVGIPCHRVVRNDRALSGYRWGVDRKRELLARESRSNSLA
jgi:AraC family transcriptional regulator of adaptative response/methylated-DNA-[protein]-cysteine methyltransferase